jgi:hypothetical protein
MTKERYYLYKVDAETLKFIFSADFDNLAQLSFHIGFDKNTLRPYVDKSAEKGGVVEIGNNKWMIKTVMVNFVEEEYKEFSDEFLERIKELQASINLN